MKEVTIHQTIGGNAFSRKLNPQLLVSREFESAAFTQEPVEHIELLADDAFATISLATGGRRVKLGQQIINEQVDSLRVGENGVVGIRLVIFEKGWPHSPQRTVRAQFLRTEHGVNDYLLAYDVSVKDGSKLTFLARNGHPKRRINVLTPGQLVSVHCDDVRVIIRYRDEGGIFAIVAVTKSTDTAARLEEHLQRHQAGVVQINEDVPVLLIEYRIAVQDELVGTLTSDGVMIFGFEALPSDVQQHLVKAGAAATGSSIPHHDMRGLLGQVTGLGWQLEPKSVK